MGDGLGSSKLRLRARVVSPRRIPLAMLPAAGGLALVMHILAGFSLPLTYAVLVILGLTVWLVSLRFGHAALARQLGRRVIVGAACGAVATAAYDAARYGLVALASWSFQPFHAWSLFGEALLGPDTAASTRFTAGALYHLMNGIGFGIAFALVMRRPTWWLGVAWGLGLEFAMALLYPRWMRIAQLQEFLTVSVLGHVVYGATLGILTARWLQRDRASRWAV